MTGAAGFHAAERSSRATLSRSERRFVRNLLVLIALLGLCTAIAAYVGYQPISVTALRHDDLVRSVFWRLRFPRVLMAGVVGGTLAVVGAALQAMFRNPLAEPVTLGVSGGSALGASIAIALGWGIRIGSTPIVFLAAFTGALASVSVVYRLSRTAAGVTPGSLLLGGIVLNLIANAAVLTIEFTADQSSSLQILRFLIGNLDVVGFHLIGQMLIFLVPGWVALFMVSRQLHLMAVDEEAAKSLGVNVSRTERIVYLTSSLLVGVTVSVGGSIGFVGLIVPHIARMIFGQDARLVLPYSLLLGAAFLMLADALARTVLGQTELPVGAVTGLLGGPFFLWLMKRQRRYTML